MLPTLQGSIEERMQSRPKGDFSVRERRELGRISSEYQVQALVAGTCYEKVNQRRSEIQGILSDPERLQALGIATIEQQKRA